MTVGRLRVVDLTDDAVVYATRLLADLGAEVIRVESPRTDRTPPSAGGEARRVAFRQFFDAGKRSVAIDLARGEGREVLARLCAGVDIVVDGLESAVEPVDGFYAQLRATNPRLSWVAVRPFAREAAGEAFKSSEIVRYALSGLMSITGNPQDSPMLVGGGLSNAVVAAYAALACYLAARLARRTGRGRLAWVSAHEALLTVMQQGLYEAAFTGNVVRRGGSRHAHIAIAGALPCRGGHVVVSANERGMWRALVELIGDARLRDEALSNEVMRLRRQAEIFGLLAQWTQPREKEATAEAVQARHIPAAPVNSVRDVLRDGHLRVRGFFHPTPDGSMPAFRMPWTTAVRPAPGLGEDTEHVLRDAGFDREEIERLEARGVVARTGARV